ncbi:MAG: hypothetical protein ACFCBU_16125 [Cyanophyceae cyanobacterium]
MDSWGKQGGKNGKRPTPPKFSVRPFLGLPEFLGALKFQVVLRSRLGAVIN